MQFLIADSFTDSLVRLTSDEQKAVKTTAFDLQLNPAKPGHKLHKLDKAKDKNGSYWNPGWSRIPLRYKILITGFTPHTRSILGQGRLDV